MKKIIIIALAFALNGCCSAVVKDKVKTEVAVHKGYVRLIDAKKVSQRDLEKMVRASLKGWQALDYHLNDAPRPEGEEE